MKPMPNLMFRGWVVWLGGVAWLGIGQGPWRPPSFYHSIYRRATMGWDGCDVG
jgi:hypothetical protein